MSVQPVFTFESGEITGNLDDFDEHIQKAVIAAAGYTATLAETYMKQNASWTDRTGAARNGLGVKVVSSTDKVAIVLFHSVPYGVFLELRWDGKYAIIEPTMAAVGPHFVEVVGKLAFGGI